MVRIETAATSSGMNASAEAKTNSRTASAPSAPSSVSVRTPLPPGLVPGRERIHAGDTDHRTLRRGGLDGGLHRLRREHVGEARGERVEHHRVRRAVVGGAERLVPGVRLVDHTQGDAHRVDCCEGLRHLVLVTGDGLTLRHRDRGEERCGVPAVVERRDDLVGGRVTRLARQREADRHAVVHRARDHRPGDRDHDPGHHHQCAVPQHQLSQTTHGRSSPSREVEASVAARPAPRGRP